MINVDNCGVGQVCAVTKEGLLWPYHAAPELLRLADRAIRDHALDARLNPYRTLTTDALAAMTRGFPTLSVMAMDRSGVLPHWHWPSDIVSNVDMDCVTTAARLVVEVVRDLDRTS